MKAEIGVLESGDSLDIDIQRLLDTRLLIQANSGGGKSWALRRVHEQTHGQVQQIVLDTEGEFVTMREKFDYILCAPAGADVVATINTATLLARHLRESRVSAIIDLYDLKMPEGTPQKERTAINAKRRFVRLFLEEFIDAPKTMWHPALVTIDEAHLYCPEKGESEASAAVIDLCSRGRKRGLAALLATQRLSKLHKDAAAECLNKLVGRTGLDVDVKRAAEELGMGSRDAVQTLRNLDPGQFFCFGPALTKTVTRVSVGPVLTRHPKAGDRGVITAPEPSETIRKILAQLADLPQQAEQEARTLQELRDEVSSLRWKLAAAESQQKVETTEVSVLTEEDKTYLNHIIGELSVASVVLEGHVANFNNCNKFFTNNMVGSIQEGSAALIEHLRKAVSGVPIKLSTPARQATAGVVKASSQAVDGALTGTEQKILDSLGWFYSLGILEPEEAAVAFFAGYTVGGGAFNNPKGKLRGRGYIDYRAGGKLALTQLGLPLASMPATAPTNEELHQKTLGVLPGPHAKLLRILIDNYPEEMPEEALASQANYAIGGAFNNPKGRLRSLGLVTYPRPKHIRAADCLFPGAR